MNTVGLNNVSLKYEMYASSGCWDIVIIKLGYVAKNSIGFYKFREINHELQYTILAHGALKLQICMLKIQFLFVYLFSLYRQD